VQLEAQAYFEAVAENPLGELTRVELAEDGREDDFVHALAKAMFFEKVASVKVIALIEDDELDLVLRLERREILKAEFLGLAASGTLDVHDFHHRARKFADEPLAARLDQNPEVLTQQAAGPRRIVLFLQQPPASRIFHQPPAERLHAAENRLRRHLFAAVKRVGGIAPVATQVAAGQPNEHARQPGERGLALNGLEYFGDNHSQTRPLTRSIHFSRKARGLLFRGCPPAVLESASARLAILAQFDSSACTKNDTNWN